jgi:dolichyl-phosphate beta-glucosyltransferase
MKPTAALTCTESDLDQTNDEGLPAAKSIHLKYVEHQRTLSVLIPAYNAEAHLKQTVTKLVEYLRGLRVSFEIVITNDGSLDKTAAIISELRCTFAEVKGVTLQQNRGKGAAVRAAFQASSGERILFMDADGATGFEAISLFMAALEIWDVAIATRSHASSIILTPQPMLRRLMSLFFKEFVKKTVGLSQSDTQCGFKMFTRPAATLLFRYQRIERFAFDVEHCFLARAFGLRLVELPVAWNDRDKSSVRIVRDPINMISDILRIRLNALRGFYKQ